MVESFFAKFQAKSQQLQKDRVSPWVFPKKLLNFFTDRNLTDHLWQPTLI